MRVLSFLLSFMVVSSCVAVPADAESVPCRQGGLELRGASSQQLYDQANYVAFVTVSEFTPDKSDVDYAGVYTLTPLLVFKGEDGISKQVLGALPHTITPQFSFDITQSHSEMNYEHLYGGTTGLIEDERFCALNPKLVVGWNYLVFLGVNSQMAFEPIHSPNLDGWYQEVSRISSSR